MIERICTVNERLQLTADPVIVNGCSQYNDIRFMYFTYNLRRIIFYDTFACLKTAQSSYAEFQIFSSKTDHFHIVSSLLCSSGKSICQNMRIAYRTQT